MGGPDFAAPDWGDPSAYAHLMAGDRSAFAWEWLRRSPEYRAAAVTPPSSPAQFGLCRFEDPALSVGESCPIWRSDCDPSVLRAIAHPVCGDGAFDVTALPRWTAVQIDAEGEHWRIGHDLRSIRLDIIEGTLRDGPVQLEYRIGGLESAIPAVLTLRRFLALACTRRWPAKLFPRESRAPRWIATLRAHDAVVAGASQRDIAVRLFGPAVIGPRWRTTAPSYRLRVQRLVAGARAMANGGWRTFLDSPPARLRERYG